MRNFVLGIDQGKSGAVSFLNTNTREIKCLAFEKHTPHDLAEQVFDIRKLVLICYLERVSAMPKQGVSSSFNFGANYGWWQGVLDTCHIPYEKVSPQIWQRTLNCLSKGNKNVTKAKAQQLYPDHKITHAIADSMLIATYGAGHYLRI